MKKILSTLVIMVACFNYLSYAQSDTILSHFGFEANDASTYYIDSVYASSGNIKPNSISGELSCRTNDINPGSGKMSIAYSGKGNGSSYCTFIVLDVNIPVSENTILSYSINPLQHAGRFVAIDLITKTGNTLRDCGAKDQNGVSMHPNAGHGGFIPLNSWTLITSEIGNWMKGDTIRKILINYDQPKNAGDFSGFIDDLLIYNGKTVPTNKIVFETGFESDQEQPNYLDSVFYKNNVTHFTWASKPECSPRMENARTGNATLMFSGQSTGAANTDAYCVFKVFDVEIPVASTTKLSYWLFPENENAKYVAIDLITKTGNTLRDCGAVDQNGFRMHPNAGHGGNIPLANWSQFISNIGYWLNGDTIDYILVNYDSKIKGDFKGFIDDLSITSGIANDIKSEKIEISTSGEAKISKLGESILLKATLSPENTTVKELIWSSSNVKVATVDEMGKVSATGNGTVTIQAMAKDGSGAKSTINIEVTNQSIIVNNIELNPQGIVNMDNLGGSINVTAKISPDNATNKNILWKTSDNTVIAINSKNNECTITALKNGSAILTAWAESNPEKEVQLVVFVTNQTGSPAINTNDGIRFYPNPVNDWLVVNSDQLFDGITIFNLNGKVVKKLSTHNKSIQINTEGLLKGEYLMKVSVGNHKFKVIRFIKD